MGLCKCRQVTNLFCFVHRKNVCQYCIIQDHPTCMVKSYLQWLQDSDFDPGCNLCHKIIDDPDTCVRLTCLDLFHYECLDKHFKDNIGATADNSSIDRYKCPVCNISVFPNNSDASSSKPAASYGPIWNKLQADLRKHNCSWAMKFLPAAPALADGNGGTPPSFATPIQENGTAVNNSSTMPISQRNISPGGSLSNSTALDTHLALGLGSADQTHRHASQSKSSGKFGELVALPSLFKNFHDLSSSKFFSSNNILPTSRYSDDELGENKYHRPRRSSNRFRNFINMNSRFFRNWLRNIGLSGKKKKPVVILLLVVLFLSLIWVTMLGGSFGGLIGRNDGDLQTSSPQNSDNLDAIPEEKISKDHEHGSGDANQINDLQKPPVSDNEKATSVASADGNTNDNSLPEDTDDSNTEENPPSSEDDPNPIPPENGG